jgi:hypothetical protein
MKSPTPCAEALSTYPAAPCVRAADRCCCAASGRHTKGRTSRASSSARRRRGSASISGTSPPFAMTSPKRTAPHASMTSPPCSWTSIAPAIRARSRSRSWCGSSSRSAARSFPQGSRSRSRAMTSSSWEGRIDLLVRNGQMGFILVLISLALFLRLKLALWVTVGVPLSFLGAFWLLPGMEVSINMISLFGFIVVLGIVVDDAIVIGENVYSHLQRGKTPLQAAKEGALEVATPVLFAVLTTIAAFSVMLGIEGTMGQFSRNIPLVVIACLAFSVVEAFFILPAHLRHLKAEGEQKHRGHLQAVACVPGHLHRRPAPLDQEGLRAVAGLAAPLALRDDRRLYRHAARQRRPRDQRRNQVRLLPARRERHHRRGLDDAARHTCRGDAARSRQAAGEHPLRRSRSRRRSQAGRGHRAARAHFGRFAALCRCAATEYGRHRRERVGVAHRRSDGRAGPRRRA